MRMRVQGSSGGHNGLKSLISVFGTDFPRLRIGIGRDREQTEAIGHVLGAFNLDEQRALPEILDRSIIGIELWLNEGPVAAMNVINGTAGRVADE
jgi:peptidyl-tRNA hydrolase, PTH1 family